ncbi:hypothetical protein FF011L_20010 [Roseimaritima multifibrata]|uniref:Uncharacterized protein n=1 Tax=Roseimaritima multifibrata TaxID=1930274 RepID=A0A517MEC1_9BACT|nr:hypothetical protein [Roseimaritima multifibrata]QDS93240.1 hypothetical protein FF011L_20010 [Roseimaritima multifibrata]
MSPSDVSAIVGPPQEITDCTLPDDSGWGLQDSLHYKIRGGEPVLQWTYLDHEHDYVVWFAKPIDEWLLTLCLTLPRGMVSRGGAADPVATHSSTSPQQKTEIG